MSDFYTRMAATGARLVAKRGRNITYVVPQTSAELINPSRPWKGHVSNPPPPPPDPAPPAPPNPRTILKTVVIPPNAVRIFGLSALGDAGQFDDLIRNSEKILIVSPGELDVRKCIQIIDENISYGVIGTQVLKPGEVTLLAYLGVRR